MKIYTPHKKQRKGEQAIIVTPGRKNPETGEFMTVNDKGDKVPMQFRVVFQNGIAEVTDALGKWMVDNGHASKKAPRLIMLPGEA